MGKQTTYAAVFSDLHFGDTRCSLHSMNTARALVEKLRDFSPLTEIILLGDILDLQLANWAQAMEGLILKPPLKRATGFRYFINFLLKETGARKVVYVPGNHDYKIFDYHSVDRHLLAPLKQGKKLSGKISFFRSFSGGFLQGIFTVPDTTIRVVYPHYSMKINGSNVILTHGHFFDPTQAFSHEIGKVFSESGGLSPAEIRKKRHEYFRRVSLYQNLASGFSMKKEFRELFSAVYQPFTSLKQKLGHRSHKTFLTPATLKSIASYLAFCCRSKKVEGLIFGHTHHPGNAFMTDGPVRCVWNCGSFLRESPRSAHGSFITIRNGVHQPLSEAVQVHELRLPE